MRALAAPITIAPAAVTPAYSPRGQRGVSAPATSRNSAAPTRTSSGESENQATSGPLNGTPSCWVGLILPPPPWGLGPQGPSPLGSLTLARSAGLARFARSSALLLDQLGLGLGNGLTGARLDVLDEGVDARLHPLHERLGIDAEEHDQGDDYAEDHALTGLDLGEGAIVVVRFAMEDPLVGPQQVQRSEDDARRGDDGPPAGGQERADEDEVLA